MGALGELLRRANVAHRVGDVAAPATTAWTAAPRNDRCGGLLGPRAVGDESPRDVLQPRDRVAVRDHVVGDQAHAAQPRVGPVEAGTPQLVWQPDPPVLRPAACRARPAVAAAGSSSTDLLKPVPATTPVTSSQPGILAVGRARRGRAARPRPGSTWSISPTAASKRPSCAAGLDRARASRGGRGAVPRRTSPRNSIRSSNGSAWKTSIPSDSNRQRGTFRSCVSGCGLRVSASTDPPASSDVGPLVDRRDAGADHDVAAALRVLLGLVGLHDPVGELPGPCGPCASAGGKDSGPCPSASITCLARPMKFACSSYSTKCGSGGPRAGASRRASGRAQSSQPRRRATTVRLGQDLRDARVVLAPGRAPQRRQRPVRARVELRERRPVGGRK